MFEQLPYSSEYRTTDDGRYRILQLLGRGAMGWVCLAVDLTLSEQQVALKFLHPHLLSNDESFRRFRNEVLVARKLVHPNIVRTFNIGLSSASAYLAMEYVEGKTLRALLDDDYPSGMPQRTAVTCAIGIGAGMQHAHALGIVHRDIKPENILCTADGRMKVSDFGISASVRRETQTTRAGRLLGTPYYMAPEQFTGSAYDIRADIYSFGIMLFEMTHGHVPFDGESLFLLAEHHAKSPLKFDESQCEPRLQRIIARCCEKEPERRFASMEEVLQAFSPLHSEPLSFEFTAASPAVISVETKDRPARLVERAFRPLPVLLFLLGLFLFCRANPSTQRIMAAPLFYIERQLGQEIPGARTVFNIPWGPLSSPLASEMRTKRHGVLWARLVSGDDPNAAENRDYELNPYPHHRSPLSYAIGAGDTKDIEILLSHGADPNTPDELGQTPLHLGILYGPPAHVKLLLDAGADPNRQTSERENGIGVALRYGAGERQRILVRLLRHYGGRIDMPNEFGQTALQIAFTSGNVELLAALLEGAPGVAKDELTRLIALAPADRRERVAQFVETLSVR